MLFERRYPLWKLCLQVLCLEGSTLQIETASGFESNRSLHWLWIFNYLRPCCIVCMQEWNCNYSWLILALCQFSRLTLAGSHRWLFHVGCWLPDSESLTIFQIDASSNKCSLNYSCSYPSFLYFWAVRIFGLPHDNWAMLSYRHLHATNFSQH